MRASNPLPFISAVVLCTQMNNVQAQRSNNFDDWDADKDGFVSKSEFPERFPPAVFGRVDTNEDGKLSREEDATFKANRRGGSGRRNQPQTVSPAAPTVSDGSDPLVPMGTRVSKDIVYERVGERELLLDLYLPAGVEESMPLVIWIHGGGWKGGSKDRIRNGSGALKRGYALASVSYRLSGEAIFPAAIEDCKAAVSFLRLNAKKFGIDPERFGVWGSSAGGHLVALLGVTNDVEDFNTHPVTKKASSKVQAVCNWFGPTDFLRMNDVKGKMDHNAADSPESLFIGALIQDHPEKTQKANPINYVSPSDPPMLLMHGDKDGLVIYNQSELLFSALQEAFVPSYFYRVVNGDHGFRGADESTDALVMRAVDFFDRELR